jgi:hypothetical protein
LADKFEDDVALGALGRVWAHAAFDVTSRAHTSRMAITS